ncbi:Uncharacterised protein [Collinsella aerofaciens]|uniref:DUF4238 domain-containing protein n=3 Tax=Collinsella aerofaciens TaxID=74426 RepID=A0A6N3C763_9ACTN
MHTFLSIDYLGSDDMSDVKKQHYVPQFYLRSFTDDGFLYAAGRGTNGVGSAFKTRTDGVCAERYLYEIRRRVPKAEDAFVKKGAAEHTLGKIENILASKYESLLGYLDVRKFPSRDVTCEILDHLICLMSMLIVRNPVYLNAERGSADDFANQLKASGFLTEEDRTALKAEGFEGEFNSIVEFVLQGIVLFNLTDSTPLLSLVSLMREMDCCFCVAPDGSEFITSSYPAFAEWADLKDADPYSIYFPLSPRYGAFFKRKSDSERLVSISPINSSMWVRSTMRSLMVTMRGTVSFQETASVWRQLRRYEVVAHC